jgi:hypothetical protein
MIICFIPALGGKPQISAGVQTELIHARNCTKETYVIWQAKVDPSPFIKQYADKIFPDFDSALKYFAKKRYIPKNYEES